MALERFNIYGVIYKITNKINGKVYIGQTTQKGGFDRRYHYDLERYTHNEHLKKSIRKYGIENFDICKVFDIAFSQDELNIKEQCWISIYNATNDNYGYNNRSGGSNCKGKDNPMYGVHRYGVESPMYGKHHSEETKKKIGNREYKKGKDNPKSKPIICLTTNKKFSCLREAGEYYNIKHPNAITLCCQCKRKSAGKLEDGTKLVWSYFYDENEVVLPC